MSLPDVAPPPLLIGLDVEQARGRAAAAGWRVAEVARTAPPSRPATGKLRVVRQKVTGLGSLGLVVAAGIELGGQRSRGAPG